MKEFIQNNGGMLTVVGVGIAILAGYGEWRISTNIDTALKESNIVAAGDLDVIAAKQEAIKDDVSDLKNNDERIDDKLDRIVDILLEDE